MKRALVAILVLGAFVVGAGGSAEAGGGSEALWSRGLAALGRGDSAAAIPLFDLAVAADPSSARARFYRGLALRAGGQRERAIADLRAAAAADAAQDPVVARAALELARTLMEDGRSEEARPWADRAAASPATSAEAGRLASAPPDARARSRLSLRASSTLDYDSNVQLTPDDARLQKLYGLSDEADGRAILEAAAGYELYRSSRFHLVGAYSLLQSLHFSIDDSDLQRHETSLAGAVMWQRVSVGGTALYDFYLLDSKSFLGRVAISPWIRLRESRHAELALSYDFRRDAFEEAPFDSLSDGNLHTIAAVQAFDLGDSGSRLTAGYRYERREAADRRGASLAYDAHVVGAGVALVLPLGFTADAAWAYRDAQYDNASRGREDTEHRLVLGVGRQFTSFLWLRAAHHSSFHDSNHAAFEYRRHVTSIALEVRY